MNNNGRVVPLGQPAGPDPWEELRLSEQQMQTLLHVITQNVSDLTTAFERSQRSRLALEAGRVAANSEHSP